MRFFSAGGGEKTFQIFPTIPFLVAGEIQVGINSPAVPCLTFEKYSVYPAGRCGHRPLLSAFYKMLFFPIYVSVS